LLFFYWLPFLDLVLRNPLIENHITILNISIIWVKNHLNPFLLNSQILLTLDIMSSENFLIFIEIITWQLEKLKLSSEMPIETKITRCHLQNGLISINFLLTPSKRLIKEKNIGLNKEMLNSPLILKQEKDG